MTIRNRLLPVWVHRVANGLMATTLIGFSALAGWRYFGANPRLAIMCQWLLCLAAPLGIFFGAFAPSRFSLIDGIAGEVGYEELLPSDAGADEEGPGSPGRSTGASV